MRELALHILDLVQNSIEAGALQVILEIIEDYTEDKLIIRIKDNGRGMDKATSRTVTDPFITTRKTRRIGLGLPLVEMSSRQCDGYLSITSEQGSGTLVEVAYRYSHIDRPPLGNMVDTLKALIIANPDLDFQYSHIVEGVSFSIATREILEALGDVPLAHPEVIEWLNQYLMSHLANLYGGASNENY